jgi:predicted HicB family RNase H-like nuclease
MGAAQLARKAENRRGREGVSLNAFVTSVLAEAIGARSA